MEYLYGKHPILEALRAGRRRLETLFYRRGLNEDHTLRKIIDLCQKKQVKLQVAERDWLVKKSGSEINQGLVAQVGPLPQVPFKEWTPNLGESSEATLLALDRIQDPQNLGAILRSAEATGVEGIILPERHSCPLSPAVSKASAGAMEHLPIFRVANLVRALEALKKLNFWAVGTELGPEAQDALDFDWPERTLLVMGAEGSGLRELTRKKCDFLIQLPLKGKVGSLNVAQTATACLYLRLSQLKIK